MKLLAVDPGPTESAFVIWNGMEIIQKGKVANNDLFPGIGVGACLDMMAIEMIASYGMAVGAEVFETCVVVGQFMERWKSYSGGLPLLRVPRLKVKSHLCHSAKANDANIRQALIDRLGPPGKKKQPGPTFGVSGDVWAALAVAVTVWDQEQVRTSAA
jgi:hypothetical protein